MLKNVTYSYKVWHFYFTHKTYPVKTLEKPPITKKMLKKEYSLTFSGFEEIFNPFAKKEYILNIIE